MPRVTRRSVAAKEDSTPEQSPRPTSRGRRSGPKKEEPKAEEVAIGEPQDDTPKRGGRQAKTPAKEPETKVTPSKGRAASRGRGRGRKSESVAEEVPEPQEEEEEKEPVPEEPQELEKSEEKETTPQGRRGRNASRGRGASASKNEASTSRSRSTRGRATKEEKEEESASVEEKSIEDEKATEESPPVTKGRGRSRGKAKVETTPSPRISSRSSRRGKDVAEEKEQEMEVEPEETKEKGSSKADEEAKGETPDQPKTQEKSEDTVESMDTAEVEANVSSPKKKTESPAKAKNTTPAKKRKLEEDEEEAAAKRLKTVEPEPTEIKDLSDYVMVNKEDVPAADSKEVLDCVPKLPEEPVMETDDAASRVFVPPSKDGGPIIVPLTEAELAKQYTQVPVDRDEASSILVEVGSESAADTTSMSVRSLDVSDAVSMDSISTGDDAATAPGQRVANPSAGGNSVPSAAAPVKQDTAEETGGASAKEEVKASPMKEDAKKSSEQQEITNSPAKEVKSSPAKEGISASPAQQEKSSTVNQNNVQQVNNIPIPAQSQTASAVEASPAHPSPVLGATTDAGATHIAKNGTHSPSKENNTSQVSSQDVISKSPVKPAAQPNNLLSSSAIDSRKFVLNPAFPLELMDPAFCFSVVSYNILAECHWKRQDYSYTPSEYMEQGYRHSVLLKELDYLEGDIVCMQEVDPKYYKDTLLPAMTSRGYSGSFIKRTQDYFDEGEATFVKNSRFNIKHSEGISLKELAYKEIDESGLSAEVSAAVKEYLDRSDVIMLTQLECVKTGKMLTVANIHVVYSPDAPDVQCIEIACAIKQLVSKAGSDLNPYIICGDFNCKTTMPGYQLAKDGYLSDDHIRTLQNLEALKNTDGSSRSLIHHLWKAFQHTSSNLKSAYEVTMSKEPVLTSYTNKTHGCLDYVFYSSASLDTVGVLETLDESVLTKNGGIPEVNIPSDHLSLKAVFRMK